MFALNISPNKFPAAIASSRLSVAAMAFVSAVGALPAMAADVPPPRWEILEICQARSEGDSCPRVESNTRRALLDRWTALPADNRLICKEQVDVDGQRSYRHLASCLDDLALRSFEGASGDQSISH